MKRGGALPRRTELKRGTPLSRTGFRRASVPTEGSAPPPRRPRDTGPTQSVRQAVLERDGWACVCCAVPIIGRRYSLQHRDPRGMGGSRNPAKNRPSNLITLLGDGTTGCHGRVENHDDPADGVKGYRLKSGQDPATTPILLVRQTGARWVQPTDDGRYVPAQPPQEWEAA